MTDKKQPEALAFCWATELAMTQQPVTLSVTEAREVSAEMQHLHTENTALHQGYAAARLEIQSLQVRIKTMAEEHADELMVAHMDGRMRAEQPAGAQQPGAAYAALPYKQALGSKNCMQCCVSYMLGLPLESVPDFATDGGWELFSEFAESKGYAAVMLPGNREFEADYLASGTTERGTSHMVVMNDGKLVHDPHPSNAGLVEVQCAWLLAKRATPRAVHADEQAAFEAVAKADTSNVSFIRDDTGYVDMTAALLWHGWKLRASHGQAPAQAAPAAAPTTQPAPQQEVPAQPTEPREWAKISAGYAHVDSMLQQADGERGGPFWHGWALREAFVAGAEWQEGRKRPAAPKPSPAAQGDALPREEFAWLVVREACETEPADEDDPECIRILRRDLKSSVLAAFLRHDAARAAQEGKA